MPSHSFRPFWPPLALALAAGALLYWSSRLPGARWEASAPAPVNVPETAPAPAPTATATTTPSATPATPAATAQPTPAQPTPTEAPTPKATPTPSPTPPPSPTPTDAELAGPLPRHTEEEQQNAAKPTATKLDIGQIARDPQLWPREVVLVAPVRFSIVSNGAVAGNLQMPQGRAVLLRQVNPDGTVLLELPAAPGTQTKTQAKTKAQATDLQARAQMIANSRPAIRR